MAEIQTGGRTGKRLAPPRVDLTPMVDLGFLLITFFMYTTTMARPKLLELQMPYKTDKPLTAIPEESTLVLLPAAGHRYGWYRGVCPPADTAMHWTDRYGLRGLLLAEQRRLQNLPASYSADAHKLHLLIHPDTASQYDDIVRIMDEIAICDVPHYFIGGISPAEARLLKKNPAAL